MGRGRALVVAHRDQSSAHAARAQRPQCRDHEHQRDQGDVVDGARRLDRADPGEAGVLQAGVARRAFRHPRLAEQPRLGDEGERERRRCQEQATEAEGGESDEHGDERGRRRRHDEDDREPDVMRVGARSGVRADPGKGCLAQGHLPGVAREQDDAQNAEGPDQRQGSVELEGGEFSNIACC